ncbi:hypothetical protein V8B55DRAFT_1513831 [Mucor lusitanicus]|uniref:Uncharacterized protein n=2 Tax=Mucor circinelloides f. lusitanicus TaxID=29924 RepID=A0A168GKC5_MUCCL|nr:hypothetical protein MUCCIDRAFT_115848 [Mucor lusitanicus CBS 277.49]
MNTKTFLTLLAVVCIIAVVQAQSSANPIESLQSKASSVAASATNTSPAAPSNTNSSAAFSLGSGLTGTVLMQVVVLGCAFLASSFLA